MPAQIIYAVNVGSTRMRPPAFGWARLRSDAPGAVRGGVGVDDLVVGVRGDLVHGRSVALGLEAPLFIPVPEASHD